MSGWTTSRISVKRPPKIVLHVLFLILALVVVGCGSDQAREADDTAGGTDIDDDDTAGAADIDEEDYPTRAVEVLIPYPPGGGQDRIGRLVAANIGAHLDQPMVILNRPGAAGAVAAAEVARSTDPHTVLFTDISPIVLRPHIEDVGYTLEDFRPVVEVGQTPLVLVAGPSSPVQTLDELVEYGQANPGELTLATAGLGDSGHVAASLVFANLGGLEVTHVPFEGGAESLAATLGGQVHLMTSTVSTVMANVESGDLSPIFVTSPEPIDELPDAPGIIDMGLDESVGLQLWRTYFLPAAATDAQVAALRDAIVSSIAEEGYEALAARAGEPPEVVVDGLEEKYAAQFEAARETIATLIDSE